MGLFYLLKKVKKQGIICDVLYYHRFFYHFFFGGLAISLELCYDMGAGFIPVGSGRSIPKATSVRRVWSELGHDIGFGNDGTGDGVIVIDSAASPSHESTSAFRQRTRQPEPNSGSGKLPLPSLLALTRRRIELSDRP